MTKAKTGHPFVDTDVIIRLLTGDDPRKQERSRDLFKQVERGELTLNATVTMIADCLYVLTSPHLDYHLPKNEAVGLLMPILRLAHFKIPNKQLVYRALDLFVGMNIDFGDAYLVASMEKSGSDTIFSYDQH